ncbi:hypothetical protein DN473_32320, partial [Burkholderia multivorans]
MSGSVTGLIDPVLRTLDPVFGALDEVIDLTINEQFTTPVPQQGDRAEAFAAAAAPRDMFTVNAVRLEVLPGADDVEVNLASSVGAHQRRG